ncbi:hypothetical protein TREMEDRAFT_58139 [Tremella mesenterica DSM 1558]|uniref:uncharacterized protein n=1 Tax=Tremella mesenterica (strain ATCC 24925 / CBS 8224 / DSM 1558 / NBRC 9311 / NRRL Y-6157 / RJB 2259-6 / UBC 559-6) TaxID=578456 RepID=UPI0003F48F5E|nr:uncharacterized protein TREMEDRAFT_58139 [Tremella mesenterica DSM 1558]EIW71995.1 hypothetical protein TREMEDRAFT_58139 [Tremella mesenterica DSM 1558]
MQTPDPTSSHLLSLPPLLYPISPSLAALHLARVRLTLSLPPSSYTSAWCAQCGGLRSGTKMKRRYSEGNMNSPTPISSTSLEHFQPTKSPSPTPQTKRIPLNEAIVGSSLCILPSNPLGGLSTSTSTNINSSSLSPTVNITTSTSAEEKPLDNRIKSREKHSISSNVISPTIQTTTPKRRRGQCEICGLSYRPKKDQKTLLEFPSARKVHRTRSTRSSTQSEIDDVFTSSQLTPSTSKPRSNGVTSNSMKRVDAVMQNENEENDDGVSKEARYVAMDNGKRKSENQEEGKVLGGNSFGNEENGGEEKEKKPSPISAPRLRYIPSSDPNPPTYPHPDPLSKSSTGDKRVKGESGSMSRNGGKKKKRSGLTKLLAESKAREENSSGNWGFG